MTSWVVWGLSTEGPTQLAHGSWELCRAAQNAARTAGWLTGVYRQGFEPLGLMKIFEESGMTSKTESTNRAIKATAIVAVLDELNVMAVDAERLDQAGWEAAAQLAARRNGTDWTDASEDTRKTVVAVLRQREATPDPFVGFPT